MEPPSTIVQTLGVTPSSSPQPSRPRDHTPSPGARPGGVDAARETLQGLRFDDLRTYEAWARLVDDEMPGLRALLLTLTTRDSRSVVFSRLRHSRALLTADGVDALRDIARRLEWSHRWPHEYAGEMDLVEADHSLNRIDGLGPDASTEETGFRNRHPE